MEEDRDGALVATIEAAFSGVTLGDGVGLWEAQAMDDHWIDDRADPRCVQMREKDEASDWTAISSETLLRCSSSLPFLDGEGFRFALPAFILEDLASGTEAEIVFCLTRLDDRSRSQYASLNQRQRQAVSSFLSHVLHDPDHDGYREKIVVAIDRFWNQ